MFRHMTVILRILKRGNWAISTQLLYPRVDGEHVRLSREHLLKKDAVDLRIPIGAPIAEHRQRVIKVGRLTERGEHDSAGRYARQYQGIDSEGSQ